MEYTSAQVEAAGRHLEAVSRANQLVVVGGVATSRQMANRFAERFCAVAKEFGFKLEPEAKTHVDVGKSPDTLLEMRGAWIVALSAANLVVADTFRRAGAVEQPVAVTGFGAPNPSNLVKMAVVAPLGLFKVKDRSGGLAETLRNGRSHIAASIEASRTCTYRNAANAQANGVPYDMGRFRNDAFFGYTDAQLAEAASLGVNVYDLSGDHYKPHKREVDVEDMILGYFAHANYRATQPPMEQISSPLPTS